MSYTKKTLEELDVLDDFLMNAVADDKEVGEAFCRCILSVLLQREIGKVRVTAQRTLPAAVPGHRGIRMDVEVEEYGKYNYDPFGKDYMMYTVRNRCEEVPEMEYSDGLRFIYFYSKGTKGGSEAIKAMLKYLENSVAENAADDATREIHRYISRVKEHPEVRMGYMKFEEIIASERKEAAEEAAVKTYIHNILDLLEDLGPVPAELSRNLYETDDMEVLKKYLKLAARVGSMDEFIEKMDIAAN